MDKLLRTLVENGEVSLAGIDSTEAVRHAQIIHGLSVPAARLLGRTLTVMAYMAGWLKEERGKLSVSVKHHGEAGEISVAADQSLSVRGYVYNPNAQSDELGKGYITLVRDDGYVKPFVGTCELVDKDIDKNFEYYYRLSEQLPTYIKTDVVFDRHGLCVRAGGFFLQPLPGASDRARQAAKADAEGVENFGAILEKTGIEGFLKEYFSAKEWTERKIEYRCLCSREYIAGILKGIGEKELRETIAQEGKINVHCHYCNSDYDFFDKDVDELFADTERK